MNCPCEGVKKRVKKPKRRPWVENARGYLMVAVMRFLSLLPLKVLCWCGKAMGYFLIISRSKHLNIARKNIALCYPQWSGDEIERMARISMLHLGMTAMEIALTSCWRGTRVLSCVKRVEGEALLDQLREQQTPIIFVTPHVGNWEILPFFLAKRLPTRVMYHPFKMPPVDRFMRRARERSGVQLAPTNVQGARALLLSLQQNHALLVLADHEPSHGNGIHVPFFGRLAYTSTLVPKLARKTGAVIVMVAVERLANGRGFVVRLTQGPALHHEIDVAVATTQLNAAIAHLIGAMPEQYAWNYKRFRHGVNAQYANPYKGL